MYSVNDDAFERARSIVVSVARELAVHEQAGSTLPANPEQLVRGAASAESMPPT